jgi:hypothetical protein
MNETSDNVVESEVAISQIETSEPVKRKVLTQVIPTNRLTLPKQIEIIRAYGAAYESGGGAVGIEDVTKFVGMAPATVSQTNAFLQETGIVRKDGRRFVPAAEVQAMNRLYEVNKEKALSKLGPLMEKSWFGRLVLPKLKFRPMPEEDVVHELFEAATAEAQHLPQIRMLVDYLVITGVVERDGGLLRLKNGYASETVAPAEPMAAVATAAPPATSAPALAEPPPAVLLLNADGSRRVTVMAPPTIKWDELERIKKWLEFQLIVEDKPSAKSPGSGVETSV